MDTVTKQPRPLGPVGQEPLRRLERQARTRALALCHWAADQDIPAVTVANRIGVARQSLGHWGRLRSRRHLQSVPRGRPPRLLDIGLGHQIDELLQECRGRVGLPTLKTLFPDVPRTTLKEIRTHYVGEHAPHLEHLTWTQPGTVWSADFTEPPAPIDGLYPYILSFRDLASSLQLLAWPVPAAAAEYTLQALRHLFAIYQPPLVLKTDNGSHFIADSVRRLLAGMKVKHLLSPPLTPRYNGGQEAAIGSLKTRALHIAAAAGRFDCWSCDDVETARLEANSQSRPRRGTGPSPDQLWEVRSPISESQREAFLRAVSAATAGEHQKLIESVQPEPGCRPAPALNATQRAAVVRRAVRRVLVDLGYLLVRRTMN